MLENYVYKSTVVTVTESVYPSALGGTKAGETSSTSKQNNY